MKDLKPLGRTLAASGAMVLAAFITTACGDDDAPAPPAGAGGSMVMGPPEGCFDLETFEPKVVSFRDDVYQVFKQSCNYAACHASHNDAVVAGTRLNLGQIDGQPVLEDEVAAVMANLIGVDSKAAPGTALVEPGDPLRSYLMASIEYVDGGQACTTITCSSNCLGSGSSKGHDTGDQIDSAQIDIVRSWIINGAKDD